MSVLNKIQQKIKEAFEINQELLEQFCEENQKFWETDKQPLGETYIVIGMFMVEKWLPWFESKLLFAKGLQEKTNCRIVVLDWGYNEKLEKLYGSYGIQSISLKKYMFQNPAGCLNGLLRAAGVYLRGGSGKTVINMKYKGCAVGHFMYDNTIRTIQDIYTIRKARNKELVRKVWTSYWLLSSLDKVYRKYPPAYYVFDDLVYDEGMIIEVLRNRNTVITGYALNGQKFHPDWKKGTIYWPDFEQQMYFTWLEQQTQEDKKKYIQEAEEKLKERFRAKNGNVRDSRIAFVGKKQAEKDELSRYMGLHNGKKNVVICCHTLSESAHRCSRQVYEDTYSWIEETMKLVRDNDKVNWIVKVHPIGAIKYGEVNVVENLYEKYRSDNLFLFPDEYNSALVGEIADAVITIYGTVGSEYSCMGIPVILAGKAAYSGLGYTIDAYSKEQYEETLRHIDERIAPLSKEQRDKAKLYFIYSLNKTKIDSDAFVTELYRQWWDFDTALNKGESVEEYNNRTLTYLQNYVTDNNIKETACYQAGNSVRRTSKACSRGCFAKKC